MCVGGDHDESVDLLQLNILRMNKRYQKIQPPTNKQTADYFLFKVRINGMRDLLVPPHKQGEKDKHTWCPPPQMIHHNHGDRTKGINCNYGNYDAVNKNLHMYEFFRQTCTTTKDILLC